MAMVDAMIQVLAQQVLTALQEQARFALDFQSQFEMMKTKLNLTKALLTDTENLKSKKETVKAILINLRDLICEADNILTDCLVRDEYQKDESCTSFTLQKPLFWYRTGKKLHDINAQMAMMERSLAVYLTPQDQSSHGDNRYQVMNNISQNYIPSEIIGLEKEMTKLKDWIFSTEDVLLRVGIVGMGGLGKTTITQKIFNDVASHYDQMIWVSVSQASSELKIMKSMLEQLDPSCSVSDETLMLHKLNQLLKDKKCLIVMDDVWKIHLGWWEQLCLGLHNAIGKSSCIIITTRIEDVAIEMGVDKSRIHQPETLNRDESWLLFSKYAFSRCKDRTRLYDQFKRAGKEILEKCGGLPLAIKAIAALLSSRTKSIVQWKEIKGNFHDLIIGGNFSSVMASLQLSYDELPMHLKQCLLCFSIYPEDSEIHAEEIIHWWIGEGLVQGKGSKTAKEVGYVYLSELVTRCLVEAVHRRGYDGRVYCCKMHDMVRELTIKIAEDESLVNFDEQSRQTLTPNTRWLGFTSEMNPKSLRKTPKLRALLLLSGNEVFFNTHISSLSSLRVLDLSVNKLLEKIPVKKLPGWIWSLKRLAYLKLSGFVGLRELPSSIRKLRNLQVLVLDGCVGLVKLHPLITNLKKLVVLDLGSSRLLYLPRGLERLSYLQELSGFKLVATRQSSRLLDLQGLIHLRVLRMSMGVESEVAENEREVLSTLKKLKVLSIDAQDSDDKNVSTMIDSLSPPPSLQELYLRCYRHETLPRWINPEKLSNLQYICIENGDIIDFQTSPHSVDGRLFPWNIEGLCFKVLHNLNLDWNNLERDMPLLRYAEVSGCLNLHNFPLPADKLSVWRRED